MATKFRDALRAKVNEKGDQVDLPSLFREMGVIDKTGGVQTFQNAVNDIIAFRKNDTAKEWAKVIKADNFNVLNTPAIKQYWINVTLDACADERLLFFNQNKVERLSELRKHAPTGETTDEPSKKQKRTEASSSNSALNLQLIDRYKTMDHDKMWILRTGKVVEEALFQHALLLDSERLCHSFIIDMTNNDLVKQGVFTEIEWREILEENRKPNPELPKNLKAYMNSLNSNSFSSLRSKLYQSHAWQLDYDHAIHSDFDWVHNTMLNMVRLLQSKNLAYNQLESWYNAHVWRFIDTVFDDNDDVTTVRGESSSKASTVRRNENRQDVAVRHKMCARFDLVIRTKHADHSKNIELGGGECGKNHEDATGTKRLNETKLKLPKSLKDMINDILSVYPGLKNDIETFGFATYGLSMSLMKMDVPCGYVCRLLEAEKSCTIDPNERTFMRSFLPCLYLAWMVKSRVTALMEKIKSTDDNANDDSDGDWIDNVTFAPRTSASVSLPSTSK